MKYLLCFLLIIQFVSCKKMSPDEKSYVNTFGKKLDMKSITTVFNGRETIDFKIYRKKYDYISIVYLQENCNPCSDKYITWHRKMESFGIKNYSILFILHGVNYRNFINDVNKKDSIDSKYYMRLDPLNSFLKENNKVPKWIIENSLLIDKKNKIKLIGEPYYSPALLKEFLNIVLN